MTEYTTIAEKLKAQGYRSHIHYKGTRGHSLSEAKQQSNTRRSKVRVRVEHIFGRQHAMGGKFMRSIGINRANTIPTRPAMLTSKKRKAAHVPRKPATALISQAGGRMGASRKPLKSITSLALRARRFLRPMPLLEGIPNLKRPNKPLARSSTPKGVLMH